MHLFDKVPCNQSVCEIWRRYLHQWLIYGYFTTLLIWLRNAYSCPLWGVFYGGGGWPPKCRRYCWDPQKAHPWPETRVLVYRSCIPDPYPCSTVKTLCETTLCETSKFKMLQLLYQFLVTKLCQTFMIRWIVNCFDKHILWIGNTTSLLQWLLT